MAIAKWLATEPRLLILDCPTVGVDVGARAGIFEIVHRLAHAGLAILLISDEVPEVYFNADRVLHMAEGRIVGEYDPEAHQPRRTREGRLCLSLRLPESAPGPSNRSPGWCSCCSAMSVALSFSSAQFLTFANVFNLLNTSSVNLIFAVGLLVVLISGGIDISFAVAASVVQYVAALVLIAAGGGGWVSGLLLAAVLGIGLGAVNAGADLLLRHHLHRGYDCDV